MTPATVISVMMMPNDKCKEHTFEVHCGDLTSKGDTSNEVRPENSIFQICVEGDERLAYTLFVTKLQ